MVKLILSILFCFSVSYGALVNSVTLNNPFIPVSKYGTWNIDSIVNPVSVSNNFLTDAQIRATPLAVNISGDVTVTGGLTDAQLRASAVPVSIASVPTHAVTIDAGSNIIGSISNSSFGISGSLPAGSNAIGSITNTVFGATQSGTWNVGRTWTLASSTDSTSAVITSMPSITGTVTANIGTTNGLALDSSLTTLNAKDFATETTLALIKAKTDNIDVALSTRTKPSDTQNISGTVTSNIGTTNGLALDSSLSTLNTSVNTLLKPASTLAAVTNVGSVTSITNPVAVTGSLTDVELRASAVPISAATLPLPTGGSTSALQTSGNASLTSIDGKTPALGQALAAASVPVVLPAAQITTLTPPTTVTVTQATGTNLHTVVDSGSVTATISGTPNVAVTSSVLPTGAATETSLTALNKTTSAAPFSNRLSDGTDFLAAYDLDNTGGVSKNLGVSIRGLANGTPVELGNTANPIRIDPTGTTTQPVNGNVNVQGELMSSFSPDPSNVTTSTFQPIQFDARGRVETHSTVLTDEGSFRDSFSGSSLDASWTASGSTTVTGGNLTIPSGTAAGSQTVSHAADYGPFVISTKLSISQRIANQTVFVGVRNNLTAPTIRSEFNFSGTDNTQVQCITQTSADAGNTQTTTFTLPKNQVTSTSLEYSIEVTAQQVNFLVGDVVVCTHKDSVQDPYGNYSYVYGLTNAATVTNTNIVVEWANFLNVNRLEVSNVFKGQKLEVDNIQVEDSSHATYRAAIVNLNAPNNPTDIFTITGSATKTIRIRKIGIEGTQTTASYANVLVLKRSTANSGGTSTLLTNVPLDSDNSAATATVRSYTANPTLGTLIGNLTTKKLVVNTASPGTSAVDNDTVFYFGSEFSKSVVLRGTSEVLSVNLNGTTLAGNSFNIWVEWTEEDL